MKVIKRSGEEQEMLFDKVTSRIKKLSHNLNVSPDKIAQKTFYEMYDGISTSKIDDISADISANMMTVDPDYETLAARILVSNMHKTCPKTFSESMKNISIVTDAIKEVAYRFDDLIVPDRDYLFGYFGLKTMQKVYLSDGETPQYMFLRVALGIHGDDYEAVKWFKEAEYEGRDRRVPHDEMPEPTICGWNMYMPPEQAARGIILFDKLPDVIQDCGGSYKYKDISNWKIFKKD